MSSSPWPLELTCTSFGDRGNGYAFGWNTTNAGTHRQRGASSDIRYDTLAHLQSPSNPGAFWEISLPSVAYSVHIVSGDPSYIDCTHAVLAEGALVLSGTPTLASRFLEGTAIVQVADGPGALVAQTGEVTPSTTGWVTLDVVSPVHLGAGTYWLVHVPSSDALRTRIDRSAGNGAWAAYPGLFGSVFPPIEGSAAVRWAIYATLDPRSCARSCGALILRLVTGRATRRFPARRVGETSSAERLISMDGRVGAQKLCASPAATSMGV